MSPEARYRAANRAMWAAWGLFFGLLVYSSIFGPVRMSRDPVFTVAFIALVVMIPLEIALASYAYKTVLCGRCKHRFFDRMFVLFPIKFGCAKCDASIEDAFLLSKEG